MKVVIVGGGVGGMALALSLHAAGLDDVEIYESASAIKELGVGVNVLPHAVRELTELGVIDDLARVGIPTAEMAFYSMHGQRIRGEPRGRAYACRGSDSLTLAVRKRYAAPAGRRCRSAEVRRSAGRRPRPACGP